MRSTKKVNTGTRLLSYVKSVAGIKSEHPNVQWMRISHLILSD